MKKVFNLMMALAVASLSFVACTKDEDGEENNQQQQQQQQDDSWKQKDSYVATIFTPDNITATDTQTIVPYYYYIEYARTKLTETDTSRIFSVMAFVDSIEYVEDGVDMVTIYYPYFTHIWSAKKGSGALLGGDICNYRCNLAQSRELVSIYRATPEYSGAQWCADWQNMYMKDIQIDGFDAETGAIAYYVSYQMGNLYDYYVNGGNINDIRGATLEILVSNFTLPKKK